MGTKWFTEKFDKIVKKGKKKNEIEKGNQMKPNVGIFLLLQIFENHKQENHVVQRLQKRSLQANNKVS